MPSKKKKTNSESSHSENTVSDQENNVEIKDVPEGCVCLSQFKTLENGLLKEHDALICSVLQQCAD